MSVLGAILAGGKSERFGSDKALATYRGKPLIDHVIAALASQVETIISVGRDIAGIVKVSDRPAPGMGPLAGVAGALAYAQVNGFESVVTVGVDYVGLPADLVSCLQPAPSYIANQPVIGIWPVSALQKLDAILASEERHSMLYFIEQIGARAVTLENPPANINTAADLERLEQMP